MYQKLRWPLGLRDFDLINSSQFRFHFKINFLFHLDINVTAFQEQFLM